MKRLLIFLMGLLLWSCDMGKVADPPYVSEWTIINNTGLDIVLYMEITCENTEQGVYVDIEKNPLLNHEKFWQEYTRDDKVSSEFMGLFHRLERRTTACRVYLTPVDSDEILKEWVWGKDNGAHDFFDESEWKHNSWEDTTTTYYTIYHNEWTFTITEADIGLSQRLYGNCIKGV